MYRSLIAASGLLVALAACTPQFASDEAEGAAFFAANCASCHGTDAKGGGELAAGLDTAPPDLTTLSARHGGAFPHVYVANVIDGYRRGDRFSAAMPEFGELDLGPTVIVEGHNGNGVPVPTKLLTLVTYLESIQTP